MSPKSREAILIGKLPTNPAFEPLTWRQLEYLTDQIVLGHDDPTIAEALIVLIDEIERVALAHPIDLENITVPVKAHAFYRTQNSIEPQLALITQLRCKLLRLRQDYEG